MKKFLLSLVIMCAGAFALSAQETLTVGEGTNTSSTVPLNMMYWDTQGTTTQVIYDASMLQDMQGGTITAIKFYVGGSFTEVPDAVCQISMGTTDQSEYASATAITGLTVVKNEFVSPESNVTEVEIVFDTPFVYEGGNLVFECAVTTTAGWKSNSFLGANQDKKVSMSRTTTYNFLPQTTFTYTPAELEDYAANVNVAELTYGKTAIDTEKVMSVKLKNKGLNAFTPAISGLEAPFSTTYVAAELASKESVEIPVTFAPTEYGEYTGTMTINCGEAGTFAVALSGICPNEFELTVCDGQNQNQYAPIYGYYTDTQGTFVQMLYPADMLSDIAGGKIIGVKFYCSEAMAVGTPTIELSLKGTEETAFEAASAIAVPDNLVTDLTTVASTTLSGTETELTFDFTEPYTYEGGNLAVQTLVAVKGGWKRLYFYGENQETNTAYAQWSTTGGNNQMIQFLPKMTIIYTKDEVEEAKFYAVGGFNGWNANEPLEITEEGATFDVVEDPEDVESKEFKILTAGENDWLWLGGEDANGVGYFEVTEGMMTAGTELTLDDAGANFRLPGSGNYTITLAKEEGKAPYEGVKIVVKKNNLTPTAVTDVNSKTVAGVKYVNIAGMESNVPFDGVNIVVTTFTDGTVSTTKVVK